MHTQEATDRAGVGIVARILIIDDDELFRTMLSDLLVLEGYEIQVASNGEEGIDMFRQHPPDIVITDIVMPDKEGIQTIRELLDTDADAKIIAMSGGGRRASSTDYLALAEDFGAKRTFSKPFDRTKFLGAIEELLEEAD